MRGSGFRAPIILIPARLSSRRLPGKPLAQLRGAPMIVHVWRRAVEADCARVVVAAADRDIAQAVRDAGGEAVMTGVHRSGSDRIFEALEKIDPERRHDAALDLQGDLPAIAPQALRLVLAVLARNPCDIATLAARFVAPEEAGDANIPKAVLSFPAGGGDPRALYFTRARAPWGAGPLWRHVGVYAYRRAALARFCAAAPSALEAREGLEQLRALEAGMTIQAGLIDSPPVAVDTRADLAAAAAALDALAPPGVG